MKKSMLFGSLLMLAIFPVYLSAQEIQLPSIEIKVSQDNVPLKVKIAAVNDFGNDHKPIAWVNNLSIWDTSDWAQSTNIENQDVYFYSIHTQTSSGSSLDAEYTPDGKLSRSREYVKNFVPSHDVLVALQNSEYKDWSIIKDFFLRKLALNGSEKERYTLVMKKGKEKKTILFDANGRMLAVQEGVHLELADANF
jgi:hypothetical protein